MYRSVSENSYIYGCEETKAGLRSRANLLKVAHGDVSPRFGTGRSRSGCWIRRCAMDTVFPVNIAQITTENAAAPTLVTIATAQPDFQSTGCGLYEDHRSEWKGISIDTKPCSADGSRWLMLARVRRTHSVRRRPLRPGGSREGRRCRGCAYRGTWELVHWVERRNRACVTGKVQIIRSCTSRGTPASASSQGFCDAQPAP